MGPLESNVPEGKGWVGAAGGLWSTPGDLARWNLALVGGGVLPSGAYRLMTTPAPLDNGKVTDYGCGLTVRVQGGRQVLNHTGAVNGFATWNAVIPSTRSALTMTCNEDGGLGDLPGRVFSLLLKEPSNIPEIAGPAAPEMAGTVLTAFQKGRVDRTWFSEEYNAYLTEARLTAAGKRLSELGALKGTTLIRSHERGGMEVTWVRLDMKKDALRALMYRKPDGKIEQFFIYED
jgi:CubicO group peptidase (beta-lactamase class C family)